MTLHLAALARRLTFVSLAVMSTLDTAQAAVDVGRTIDAVSMNTVSGYNSSGGYGEPSSYSYTTATIVSRPVVVDAQTGLQWIKASSLSEGQALGYRAATADEFKSFVTQAGWASTAGSPQEFALTNGFNYVESSSSGSGGAGYSYTSRTTNNLAPVSFNADARITTSDFVSIDQAVSVAWLDGAAGGNVGAMFTTRSQTPSICSGGRSVSCSSTTTYRNEAVMATLGDLQSGAHDNAAHTTGSNWSTLMNQLPQADGSTSLMYYMVASVPEPSSYALMGLGLIGVAAAARRQRRA